jgi:hypothetical protein
LRIDDERKIYEHDKQLSVICRQMQIDGIAFDVDLFRESLVRVTPPGERRAKLCTQFAARFESLVTAGKVPTCL